MAWLWTPRARGMGVSTLRGLWRLSAPPYPLTVSIRQCSNAAGGDAGSQAYDPRRTQVDDPFPIIQLPARSLWCQQSPIPIKQLTEGGEERASTLEMIQKVKASRKHYQYPSLCAPQIGWNVQLFTLFDDSVYVNPVCLDVLEWQDEAEKRGIPFQEYEKEKMLSLRGKGKTCFAWEPCASCAFLLHYIERPLTCHLQAVDMNGKIITETLEGMMARMALHELDHIHGILFTRRVVDANHVIPLEGFCTMSDWSDDFPSLEARSTFLYTCFTPPFSFTSHSVPDANLLDRHLEDGVYPGKERDERMRIEHAALDQIQREKWRDEKMRMASKRVMHQEEAEGEAAVDESKE